MQRYAFRYVFVGLPSKFRSLGNVGTTNPVACLPVVYLMLFSLVHQKSLISSVTCETGMRKNLKNGS